MPQTKSALANEIVRVLMTGHPGSYTSVHAAGLDAVFSKLKTRRLFQPTKSAGSYKDFGLRHDEADKIVQRKRIGEK
jgi:Flp pilus assembly CpaF family ATPase